VAAVEHIDKEVTTAESHLEARASPPFDDSRLGPAWPPHEMGMDHPVARTVAWRSPHAVGDGMAPAVPRYVSPVLILLAAASILEGYTWLNVIPNNGWQPSAVVFVGVAVPLAIVLTRPRRDGRRVVAAKVVTVASVVLLVVTVLAVVTDRPPLTHLMGASDLLFALTVLAAGLATERLLHREV
jgi:hypothetical protein